MSSVVDDTTTVADHVVTAPTTLPPDATVGQVRALFADDHVHMALLVRAGRLEGCVLRDDLVGVVEDGAPALPLARLDGRTVAAQEPLEIARRFFRRTGARRLAVVDGDRRLVGLLCLKRSRAGFCSDADVAARATERLTQRAAG